MTHGALERLPAFFRAGLLQDATHLCRHYVGNLQVAGGDQVGGVQQAVGRVPASRMLDLGLTVVFDDLVGSVPEAGAWLRALEGALGLPTCSRMMAFVNAPGSGLTLHHDRYDQLLIQLEGTKTFRWRASGLEHPDLRCSHGDLPAAAFGASYADGFPPTPESVLADTHEVRLHPGSVLFLPGGTWHTTAKQDERAMSVAVIVEAPTAADLFLSCVAAQLEQLPAWRKRVYADPDLPALVAGLTPHLAELDLSLALATWQLRRSFTSDTQAPPTGIRWPRYIRLPYAKVSTHPTEDGEGLLVRVVCGAGTYVHADTTLGTFPEAGAVIEWIAGCIKAFAVSDLTAAFPEILEEEIDGLLDALGQARFIRPVPGGRRTAQQT
ncbi:MAG: hypothetical protein KC621_26990 [Myxococcales bacterium]|nr:hypothetical protein [Myxococcales bacterium]